MFFNWLKMISSTLMARSGLRVVTSDWLYTSIKTLQSKYIDAADRCSAWWAVSSSDGDVAKFGLPMVESA